MTAHVVPKKIYVAVWATLLLMTLVTTLVAFVDLARFNSVVALAIATFKATLVVLFFMGVKYSPRLTRVDHHRDFLPDTAVRLQHGRLPLPLVASVEAGIAWGGRPRPPMSQEKFIL